MCDLVVRFQIVVTCRKVECTNLICLFGLFSGCVVPPPPLCYKLVGFFFFWGEEEFPLSNLHNRNFFVVNYFT